MMFNEKDEELEKVDNFWNKNEDKKKLNLSSFVTFWEKSNKLAILTISFFCVGFLSFLLGVLALALPIFTTWPGEHGNMPSHIFDSFWESDPSGKIPNHRFNLIILAFLAIGFSVVVAFSALLFGIKGLFARKFSWIIVLSIGLASLIPLAFGIAAFCLNVDLNNLNWLNKNMN